MVTDPKRRREMVTFGITLGMLFLLVMVYLWQHFSAIEYGYKIEQLKSERDTIAEINRTLSLEEASLKDLSRIDRLAREMGMQRPVDGQWQSMDTATTDPATPVMAKAERNHGGFGTCSSETLEAWQVDGVRRNYSKVFDRRSGINGPPSPRKAALQ